MAQTPDARFAHFQLHFWLSFEQPVWHILGPKPTREIRPRKKTSPLRHLQRWRLQPQFPHHPSSEPKNGHEDPRSHERRGGHAEQSSWRKGTANTGASSCSGIYSDSNVSERYSQQGQKPQRKQTVPAIIYRISLSLFWWFRRVEGVVRTIHGLSDLGAACDELMFFLPLADAFTRVDRKVARNAGDSVYLASREAILREKGRQLRIYIACDTNGTDR